MFWYKGTVCWGKTIDGASMRHSPVLVDASFPFLSGLLYIPGGGIVQESMDHDQMNQFHEKKETNI